MKRHAGRSAPVGKVDSSSHRVATSCCLKPWHRFRGSRSFCWGLLSHPDFQSRATLTEFMDEPCGYEDFRDCLIDIEWLTSFTYGYRPTLRWLEQFRHTTQPLHILDVGSGGGAMLRRIESGAHQHCVPVRLTGVDINPYAAAASRERTPPESGIEFRTGNVFSLDCRESFDIIISSLFTHYLSDADIVRFLIWSETYSRRGWFINDLPRRWLPCYFLRVLSHVTHLHDFVKHDGPASIRRAFSRADWELYLEAATIASRSVHLFESFPARLCLARTKP